MKRFALAVAVLLAGATANAQVYEWKDEKGNTHFSDQPPVGKPRAQRVIESEPAAGPTQKTTADRELEFRKRQKASQDSSEQAKKAQAANADQKEVCENARRLLETLASGERITLRDDQGERYFMDDAQREQESAKARQVVQSTCTP